MLFNIYLSDIPQTTSHQYGYADDPALFFSERRWSAVEEVLFKDTAKIANYLLKWRLKLSMAKTTTTAFYLNNKEAKCQLAIKLHKTINSHNMYHTNLGIKLDRQLTFWQHLESLSSKVEAQNNQLCCLTSIHWGASAIILRIDAHAIVYSTAEYAAPVWGHSAHTKRLYTALNNILRIVTSCLRPTPTALLTPLAGIAPAKQWRKEIVDRLALQALSISNQPLSCYIPDIHQLSHQCLVSQNPFQ